MMPVLWFFAFVGSQFYVFSSGQPQPAHLVLVLIFIVCSFGCRFRFDVHEIEVSLLKIFSLFLVYSCLVNIVWSLIVQDPGFLKASLFWWFSFFTFFFLLIGLKNERVVSLLCVGSLVGLILLLFFWVSGMGRYNFGYRFNGYLNDPNQMAYWVICAFGVFFFLSGKRSRYLPLVALGITVLVILASASRSALLGTGFLMIGVIARFLGFGSSISMSNRILYLAFGLLIIPSILYPILTSESAITLVDRFSGTNFEEQADIRGYTRLYNYPEYLLFGAGQGADMRFNSTHEIHSSWVGLFFYYGLVGVGIFLHFVYSVFSRLDFAARMVFIGPVLYGLSTYGLRTPVFWIFMASAVYASLRETKTSDISHGSSNLKNHPNILRRVKSVVK